MGFLNIVVKRRVLTTVLVAIVVILGALSYFTLGLRRFPEIDFPVASVTTIYPGGSPEEIETEITKRIEDACSSISGIDEMTSYSQQGTSMVMIQFDLGEDIDIKAMDIRDKIDQIRRDLPEDAEDPIVGKFSIASFPVVTLALVGPQDVNELYRVADEDLSDRLSQITGVAEVQLTGGQKREIHVLLEPAKLRKHGISVDEVAAAIQSANLEIPGGFITEPAIEYTIRTTGRFTDSDQILRVPVRNTGEGVLEIRHLGTVKDTFEEARSRSRADGKNSIILSILTQSDANEVAVADGVRELLPSLQKSLPAGGELFIAEDMSKFIRGALDNVRSNIIAGIILTSIAIYLFLGSWRGTVIVAAVIPTALVATFVFLLFTGITINILTLTGLALSVGIIVNNSILILENSHRFMDEGLAPMDAAIAGTKDISLAILSSTATNLVVFLPIAFMGEIIGQFMKEFGLTIVYVTTVSLGVSFTLTPMMCGALLHQEATDGPPLGRLRKLTKAVFGFLPGLFVLGFSAAQQGYERFLDRCIRWWPIVLLVTLVAFIGSAVIVATVIGAEMFPPEDEGRFRITVETPVGSSLEFTDARTEQVEHIIAERVPHLEHYYSRVGRVSGFVGSSSRGTNLAEIGIVVCDKADRPLTVQDIVNQLRPYLAEVDSAKVSASAGDSRRPGGQAIEIQVSGPDMDELRRVSAELKDIVQAVPGTSDVTDSWRTGQPEIRIIPDQSQAGRHNLTVRDLALTLRSYIEGREVSQFRDGGEDYDIRVRLAEAYRDWGENVGGMFIKSPATGQMVRIGEVAEVGYESGPTVIMRKDRMRLITVGAQLKGDRTLGQVVADVEKQMDEQMDVPPGIAIGAGGQTDMMQKNFRELFKAMGTASVLTFLCVAGIIESFVFAIVILAAVPICLIGVAIALLVGDVSMNIFSLMAMIMLVGLVVNNAIIVLDYATREQLKHLSPGDRVRQACSVRFRVMMMANATTIIAMIPLARGLGFAGQIFKPIAVVEIGGIAAAASLSMIVIPVVYTLVERFREAWNKHPQP